MYFGTLAGDLGSFPLDYGSYHPQSDCRTSRRAIRRLVGFSKLVSPLVHSGLYLHDETSDASPKAISGRTSYHGVCLAFHPYPQLLQAVFNPHWFGPPSGVTRTSAWSRIDHPVSRLFPATVALFRLGFPTAPPLRLRLATENN